MESFFVILGIFLGMYYCGVFMDFTTGNFETKKELKIALIPFGKVYVGFLKVIDHYKKTYKNLKDDDDA